MDKKLIRGMWGIFRDGELISCHIKKIEAERCMGLFKMVFPEKDFHIDAVLVYGKKAVQ